MSYYVIKVYEDKGKFEDKVERYLREGWKLHGSMHVASVVDPNGGSGIYFVQAVIKD